MDATEELRASHKLLLIAMVAHRCRRVAPKGYRSGSKLPMESFLE